MDLSQRVLEGELMDAPDLEASKHHHALQGLERVNRLSGTGALIAHAIKQHFDQRSVRKQPDKKQATGSSQPLRILDLACGGGDVTFAVAQHLENAGLNISIEGWDRSATAIEYAASRVERRLARQKTASTANVRFVQHDVTELNGDIQFDVVMCTLFLHHLTHEQAVDVLGRMGKSASKLMLVDDLRRTWFGFRLAQLGCHLLTRSPIVHVDGPLSVRAAFTDHEFVRLSAEAGLSVPKIRRHWPQRFLASWDRSA